MIELKNYQSQTLQRLQSYLEAARLFGNKQAYDQIQAGRMEGLPFPPFQPLKGLESVPYVCLRLPTGGGKTLLCAHTIALAEQNFWGQAFPLTLWLVPTTTIKNQTLETLKNPHHANSLALTAAFGHQWRVFDIANFATIRPQDIENNACIIVATFASLRVEEKEGRRVYDHHEELEGHFSQIPTPQDGHYSFVNLLAHHRPLVLVDEAHNAKSELSVEVLRRVNPRVVIEYTATPAKNSNVIQSVTAAQLKAEQMIKLPIILTSHIDWQEAVAASIQTRAKLEQLAHDETEPLRPLVLFQAENKNGAVTVEILRDFLIQQMNIAPEQIAIATGDQRELDNINLFDANCPIRYIITVEALKEGWDCSFAYVLCSLANTHSPTKVEQLLGRVLRMPYAKLRRAAELNLAYAHVSAKGWPHVATKLADRLISMGFERQEVEQCFYQQPPLPLNLVEEKQKTPPLSMTLTNAPDFSALDLAEKSFVEVQKTEIGYHLKVQEGAGEALFDKIAQGIKHKKDAAEFQLQARQIIRHRHENLSPLERGEAFIIPQLCLFVEDVPALLEKETIFGDIGFNPLNYYQPLTQDDFCLDQTSQSWLADLNGEKITIDSLQEDKQLSLDGIILDMDAPQLGVNLAKKLYDDVNAAIMTEGSFLDYLHKTITDLLSRGDMDMPKLIRGQFLLEKILRERLKQAYQKACQQGFQKLLFTDNSQVKADLKTLGFRFSPHYPTDQFYEGRLKFKHHYYPNIAKMNKEEAKCALLLDRHKKIKYWLRNLERQREHAFSLPTSHDWFYPDFVALLEDGRILVVEYKGAHLQGSDDTREKEMIGQAWAKISGNLFLLMGQKDNQGRDMGVQLNQILQ